MLTVPAFRGINPRLCRNDSPFLGRTLCSADPLGGHRPLSPVRVRSSDRRRPWPTLQQRVQAAAEAEADKKQVAIMRVAATMMIRGRAAKKARGIARGAKVTHGGCVKLPLPPEAYTIIIGKRPVIDRSSHSYSPNVDVISQTLLDSQQRFHEKIAFFLSAFYK